MRIPKHDFYEKIFNKGGHTLVAGMTGGGKSVVLNGLIVSAICHNCELMLLDPKGGMEFGIYRDCLNTIAYGGDLDEFAPALEKAVGIMNERITRASAQHLRKTDDTPLYIVIDEFADMMSERKKELQPLLLKIARKGRAVNVRLILATQTPYQSIVTGDIKANIGNYIAMPVVAKRFSRLILEVEGAETLSVSEAMVRLSGEFVAHREHVPMYSDDLLEELALWRTPPSKRWK